MTVLERIHSYLGNGGLFNPEMMEHDKVRDLIMACREEITTTREQRDDAEAYIRAIWRKDLLPSPLCDRLFTRLTSLAARPAPCDCGGFPHGKHCAAVLAGTAEHTPTTPNGD